MTQSRPTIATTLTAILVVALVAGAAPAAADDGSDDWLPDASKAVDFAAQAISNPGAAIDGLTARFDDDADRSATDAEQEVRTYFNNRSGEFETYGADHPELSAATSRDVVRIVYEIDGETASHIAVANVSDGEYRDLTIVTSTDRTVDYECTLEGPAAKNAPDELEMLYEDYVQPNETDTGGLETRQATQYGGKVSCEEVN